MITRRNLISLIAAPAIIRVADLMPIKMEREPKLITLFDLFDIPDGQSELNFHYYVTGPYLSHAGIVGAPGQVMSGVLSSSRPRRSSLERLT